MKPTRHLSWFPAVILLGALYAFLGIVFALPASHARLWRWAAWLVSAAAFASHIGYECFRLRNSPLIAAAHVALATALGAFGLALGAIVRTAILASSSSRHLTLLLIALATWPMITGVPAFLVGLGASGLLARLSRRDRRTNAESVEIGR